MNQKQQAEKAVRDAMTRPIDIAKKLLKKEGFAENADGSLEKEIDGEVIKWKPSMSLNLVLARQLISQICSAAASDSSEKELKAWRSLHIEIGLPHTHEKVIASTFSNEIYRIFSEEMEKLNYESKLSPIVIIKVTKGLEAIAPYMRRDNDFDPWEKLREFKKKFPLHAVAA